MDYKDNIIEKIADKACDKITKRVIRHLQTMTDRMMLSDDSPLKNVWDEICVQVQDEESIYWDSYLDTVRSLIEKEISSIDEEVRQAIWFQTDEGYYWDDDGEDQEELFIDEEQISEYILRHYILSAAGNWTNKRIRKYLDIDYEFD